tara:strand:- start:153 stop:350 length:198 start_codon:yes stop_codon:yes gene_type:complete
MENTYLQAILTRMKIGGLTTPADQLMVMKYLLEKVNELEERLDAKQATVSRSSNSKTSKKKITSS